MTDLQPVWINAGVCPSDGIHSGVKTPSQAEEGIPRPYLIGDMIGGTDSREHLGNTNNPTYLKEIGVQARIYCQDGVHRCIESIGEGE